jgi:hypothetical protein
MGQRGRADRRARLGHGRHRSVDQRGAPANRTTWCAPKYITLHQTRSLISSLSIGTVGPFWAWKVGPQDDCPTLARRSQAEAGPSHGDGRNLGDDDAQEA